MKDFKKILAGLAFAVLAIHAHAQELTWRDNARSTVVMLEGTRADGTPFKGSGIIVAVAANRIYIATANHVVRSRGDDSPPTSLVVRLSFVPGESFPATTLSDKSETLDLAVIRLVNTEQPGIPIERISRRLMRSDGTLPDGSAVHAMGYPTNTPWGMNLNPERVDASDPDRIRFQSSYVQPGHSGGGLFDHCGNLVGMTVERNPPNAQAISIRRVISQLSAWNYPVNFLPSENASCAETTVDPPTCSISVRSSPSGAAVFLDDNEKGNSPTTLILERGRSFELTLKKDSYKDYEKTITCSSGAINPTLDPKLGTIRVRYTGDLAGCSLALEIDIGDKSFRPTSNLYTVRDVELGDQEYEISGRITCSTGVCTVSGQGDINVRNGITYDVVWQNTAYAQCEAQLYDHGE